MIGKAYELRSYMLAWLDATKHIEHLELVVTVVLEECGDHAHLLLCAESGRIISTSAIAIRRGEAYDEHEISRN